MNAFTIFGSLELNDRGFQTSLRQAERASQNTGRVIERDLNRKLQDLGRTMQNVGRTLSVRLTAPITAFGAAALYASGQFQEGMNRVAALSGATGDQLDALTVKARELGATTQFSATQVADAMGFMAMAGMETDEILSSVDATLRLAAAAQLDMGQAADIVTNILAGYNMTVGELDHAVDVLAKSFTSANTDLTGLAEAMRYAGPVAASAGVQFEEAAAAIALMGNAGIQGSMAGTSLRGAITRLLSPTGAASDVMEELGLRVTDANGRLLPFADIIEQLGPHAENTAAFMDLFGQRAGPAMAALVARGSDALRDLTSALMDSGGTAQRIADVQMEGLNGAMRELRSAVEAVGISIGESGLAAFMENLVRQSAGIARSIADLNPALLAWTTVIAGAAAAMGPLVLAVGTFIRYLPVMRTGVLAVRAAMMTFTLPLALITAGAYALYRAWDANLFGVRDAWTRTWNRIRDAVGGIIDLGAALVRQWETVSWGWSEILGAMHTMSQQAGAAVSAAWEVSTLTVQRFFAVMFRFIEDGMNAVLNSVINAVNAMARSVNTAFGWLGVQVDQMAPVVLDAWDNITAGLEDRIAAAMTRVADAQHGINRQVSEVQRVVLAVAMVIEEAMSRGATATEAVGEAAQQLGMDVREVLDLLDVGVAGVGAGITGAAGALNGRAAVPEFAPLPGPPVLGPQPAPAGWRPDTGPEFAPLPGPPVLGPREGTPQELAAVARAAQEQALALAEAEAAAQAHALAMRVFTDGSEAHGYALDGVTQHIRAHERATREAEREERIAAQSARERAAEAQRAVPVYLEYQASVAATAEALREQALAEAAHEQALSGITDGSEHVANARGAHIHILERQTEALLASNAALHAGEDAYRVTAAMTLESASAALELVRAQESVGESTRFDVVDALLAQQDALVAARDEVQYGGEAWLGYTAALASNQEELARFGATLPQVRADLTAQLATLDPLSAEYAELEAVLERVGALMAALGIDTPAPPQFRIGDAVTGAVDAFVNVLRSRVPLVDAAITAFTNPVAAIGTIISDLLSRSEGFARFADALNSLLDPFVSLLDAVLTPLALLVEAISSAVNGILRLIPWLRRAEKDLAPAPEDVARVASMSVDEVVFANLTTREGSIARVREQLRLLQDAYNNAADDLSRAIARRHIEELQSQLQDMESTDGLVTYYRQEIERWSARLAATVDEALRESITAMLEMYEGLLEEALGELPDGSNGGSGVVTPRVPTSRPVRPPPRAAQPTGLLGRLEAQRRDLQEQLQNARTEDAIRSLNLAIAEVSDEISRLRALGVDGEDARTIADAIADAFDNEASLGGVSQSLQFGVATPLVEASVNMLRASDVMQRVFGAMLPGDSSAPDSAMPAFTSAISNMTPVLERLLREGVSVNARSTVNATVSRSGLFNALRFT